MRKQGFRQGIIQSLHSFDFIRIEPIHLNNIHNASSLIFIDEKNWLLV